MLSAMSGPELFGFIIFVAMTMAFFAWIAYLTFSR